MSEPTPDETISGIIRQAAASEGAGAGSLTQDDLRGLADRVDLLTADFGRWESYKAASTEYIEAFRTEVNWHWRIRLAVALAGGLLILFLGASLVLGVLWAQQLFRADQAHALTALIVACISGCVIVTIALERRIFKSLGSKRGPSNA